MPTNYAFGGNRPTTLGNRVSSVPALRSSTQQTVLGIKPSSAAPARVSLTPQIDRASSDATNQVRSASNNINQFGENITQMKTIAAQRRAQRAQQEAARQQESALFERQSSRNLQRSATGAQPVNFDMSQVPATGARAHLVRQAQSMLGTPYAWGGGGYGNRGSRGTGKGTQNVIGVDCSGLTSYVYGTLGIKLVRQSDAQLRTSGYRTAVQNLKPGDLVGWRKGGHVALYVGNGQIIESPRPGKRVQIRKLGSSDYAGGVYGVHIRLPGE